MSTRHSSSQPTSYDFLALQYFTHFGGQHIVLVSIQHLRMPVPGCQNHQSGRICPHQCDTDDDIVILGANLAASDMHAAVVHETEKNDKSKHVKNDYCNHIMQIISFWKMEYP